MFTLTCAHSSTNQTPMVHQIEEMCETIQKLNGELKAKDKTFEEKMAQLMQDNEQQKECIRQQEEHMKLVLQHIQLKNIMPNPFGPLSNGDDVVDHCTNGT